VCWAHLKRDFRKLVDRGGPAARLGQRLQRLAERVFEEWHLFRGGGFDRQALQERLDGPARELERVLRAGRRCADAKAATFCGNVLELLPAVRRFVVTEGVEPTNNHTERLLRRGVLWRKNAFGCHSAVGCRLVERLLTVVQTCRLQDRPVLRYLLDALVAHRQGLPAPPLLSVGCTDRGRGLRWTTASPLTCDAEALLPADAMTQDYGEAVTGRPTKNAEGKGGPGPLSPVQG
jgi:transposase